MLFEPVSPFGPMLHPSSREQWCVFLLFESVATPARRIDPIIVDELRSEGLVGAAATRAHTIVPDRS